MTLPIAVKYSNISNPLARRAIGIALIAFDGGGPITLLVLGILGVTSVISFPSGAYWTMIGAGAGLAVFSTVSWSVFIYALKQDKQRTRPH